MVLIFQVSVLCNLFKESRSDRQSKEVLGEITDYNRRYSGAPRRVSTLSKFQQTHPFLTVNERSLLLKTILSVFPKMFSLFSPSVPVWLNSWCTFPLLLQRNTRFDHEKDENSSTIFLDNVLKTGASLMQPQGFN